MNFSTKSTQNEHTPSSQKNRVVVMIFDIQVDDEDDRDGQATAMENLLDFIQAMTPWSVNFAERDVSPHSSLWTRFPTEGPTAS